MSHQQPIIFPSAGQDHDIVDDIAERALGHAPHSYFDHLQKLPETSRTVALQDFVTTTRQLLREFSVCHDLALAQLVRAHKSALPAQQLLLGGGLEKLLGLANAKNLSMDELFQHYMLGPVPTKNSTLITEPAINTLRNRMVNLAGSERAGVGLGAVAAVYQLTQAVLPNLAQIARKVDNPDVIFAAASSGYSMLLANALRDMAQSVPGRRAVAFGATQAFQLGDDLFTFLKSRLSRIA